MFDGSQRAVAPAAVALVRERLELIPALPDGLAAPPIVNSRGIRVGELTVRTI